MNKWKKISDYLFFQEGPGVRNHQYTSNGVKLLNVANLVNGRVDLTTSDRYISNEEAYGKYKHFLADEGDLVIASSGIKVDYFDKKMGIIKKEHLPICMNTSTIRLKSLDKSKLDIIYFMYYLKSQSFKSQLSKQITGSAQLNFGPYHIKRMDFPLVDLNEQTSIVMRLSNLENQIRLKEQQLTAYDQLIKSRFVEMFGDPIKNDKNWITNKLNDVCPINKYKGQVDSKSGQVWLLNLDMIESNTGYILDYEFEEESKIASSTIKFDDNCVLYSKLRPYLNKVVVPTQSGYATSEIISMQTGKVNKYFLSNLLRTKSFVEFANGTAYGAKMPRASVDMIKNFDLIVPPTDFQIEFALFAQQVDKLKFVVQKSLDETQKLFDSLMQEYFG